MRHPYCVGVLLALLSVACAPERNSDMDSGGEASVDLSEWMRARRIEGRDIRMLGLEITRDGDPASGLLVVGTPDGQEQTTLAGPGMIQIPEAALDAAGKATLRLTNGSDYGFKLYLVEAIEQSSGPDIFRFYQGEQAGVQLSGASIDLSIPMSPVPHGMLGGQTMLLEDNSIPIMGIHDGFTVLTDNEIGFTWPPVPNDERGGFQYPEMPADRDFTLCLNWRGQQKCLESIYRVAPDDSVSIAGAVTLIGEKDDANVRIATSVLTSDGADIVAAQSFDLIFEALEGESLTPLPAFLGTVTIDYELQGFEDGTCDANRTLDGSALPDKVVFDKSELGEASRTARINYVGDVIIRAAYGSQTINPIERTILPEVYFDLTYRGDLSAGLSIVYDVRALQRTREGLPNDFVNGTVTAIIEDETGAPATGLSGTVSANLVNGQGQIAIDFSGADTANHDYVTRVDSAGGPSCRSRTPYIDFANGVTPAP